MALDYCLICSWVTQNKCACLCLCYSRADEQYYSTVEQPTHKNCNPGKFNVLHALLIEAAKVFLLLFT